MAGVHHAAGLLHPAAGLRLPRVDGCVGCYAVGFLVLLLHHHRRRAYLEVRHAGLHPAHHRGHRPGLPREVSVGRHRDSPLPCLANPVEPHPDELLLLLRHALHGHCLRRGCLEEKGDAALRESHVHARRGRCHRSLCQPLQPLPHLAVQQGVHARQERTGEG